VPYQGFVESKEGTCVIVSRAKAPRVESDHIHTGKGNSTPIIFEFGQRLFEELLFNATL